MTVPVVLGILAIVAIYAGIKGYSFTGLLFGQKNPRVPPGGDVTTTGNVPTGSVWSGKTSKQGYTSPIIQNATFERIDQGVDYSQVEPYVALGAGIVERISTGWAGGTGKAVYVKLNNPITIGGRTYTGYYVAETNPLVQVGQKVRVGQEIASGGAAELGFLINGAPTPLQGGLGAGTKPTQAGTDFYYFVKSLLK